MVIDCLVIPEDKETGIYKRNGRGIKKIPGMPGLISDKN
jgi:hypothetical protein